MTHHNKILNEIRVLAHDIFADTHASVYLYGSRARGDAHSYSDWDLLIVTDDSVQSSDAYDKYVFPFTEKGWQLGELITPLLYTESEWEAEQNTAFYLNVKKDAILL